MTEKVKITKEQERALGSLLHKWELPKREIIAKSIEKGWISPNHSSLNDFTPEEIALLLCGWYEVEQPFQVGDWVYKSFLGPSVARITKIVDDEIVSTDDKNLRGTDLRVYKTKLRHATPEEIAQEKKRRFWAELGREADEYKVGDVVAKNGNIQDITDVFQDGWKISTYATPVYNDELTLVCPVERRMD